MALKKDTATRNAAKRENAITKGGIETPVEAFHGASITDTPPFARQYGPHKESGTQGAPTVSGGRKGAGLSGVETAPIYSMKGKNK